MSLSLSSVLGRKLLEDGEKRPHAQEKSKTRSNEQPNERVSGRNGRTDKGVQGSGLGQGRQVRKGQGRVGSGQVREREREKR